MSDHDSVSESEPEHQLLLRVPPELANQLRALINSNNNPTTTINTANQNEKQKSQQQQHQVRIHLTGDSGGRTVLITVNKDTHYSGLLVDLPCIIETHKTFDSINYFKSGDIGQMVIIQPNPNTESYNKQLEKQSATGRSATVLESPSILYPSGLLPPTRDIRPKRYDRATTIPARSIVHDVENMLRNMKENIPIHQFRLIEVEEEIEIDEEPVVTQTAAPVPIPAPAAAPAPLSNQLAAQRAALTAQSKSFDSTIKLEPMSTAPAPVPTPSTAPVPSPSTIAPLRMESPAIINLESSPAIQSGAGTGPITNTVNSTVFQSSSPYINTPYRGLDIDNDHQLMVDDSILLQSNTEESITVNNTTGGSSFFSSTTDSEQFLSEFTLSQDYSTTTNTGTTTGLLQQSSSIVSAASISSVQLSLTTPQQSPTVTSIPFSTQFQSPMSGSISTSAAMQSSVSIEPINITVSNRQSILQSELQDIDNRIAALNAEANRAPNRILKNRILNRLPQLEQEREAKLKEISAETAATATATAATTMIE